MMDLINAKFARAWVKNSSIGGSGADNNSNVANTTAAADSSDWKSSCVQPAKDTRVQTEVLNFLYLKFHCLNN